MRTREAHLGRRRAPLAIAATLALLITGCGSSHGSTTGADPAGAVPASTPLYAGAIVRPEGSLKSSTQAAGRALTNQADPYLRLLRALQTPGSPPLDFGRDVAPWLGPQAGVFLSSAGSSQAAQLNRLLSLLGRGLLAGSSSAGAFPFGAHGAQGALVLDTSDVGKARSFIASQATRAGARASSYRGLSYLLTADGIAFGIVDRFAVIGSASAMRGVIDTSMSGASLARTSGYSRLLAIAPPGVLAHLYADEPAPRLQSAGHVPGELQGLVRLLAGTRPVNVSLLPSSTSLALDADALAPSTAVGETGGLLAAASQGAQAVGELPGESWLAAGLGNTGATLREAAQGLSSLSSLGALSAAGASGAQGTLSVSGLLEGFLAPLRALGASGAQAEHDFQSWMGPAALFAAGSGLLDLKGGVVIASNDAALSRAAVGKLGGALTKAGASVQPATIPGTEIAITARISGLPVVLDIAAGRSASGGDRFVIGIGEASVAAALNPSSTLASAAAYQAASATLGEGIKPSVLLDVPTFLSLLEGVGLSEDPTISGAVPYLHSLTTLAGGARELGEGAERYRLVAGLRTPH